MKIVIPHAVGRGPFTGKGLRPEVRALGESVGAEFVDCTGDDYAYYRLLRKLWAEAEPVIVLEQDVLASPELLASMWDCECEWAAGFYWHYSGVVLPGETKPQHPVRTPGVYLCCNRFSAGLMNRTPYLLSGRGAGLHWAGMDLTLVGLLNGYGARQHLHEPAVQHLARGANPPAWALAMTEGDWRRVDA